MPISCVSRGFNLPVLVAQWTCLDFCKEIFVFPVWFCEEIFVFDLSLLSHGPAVLKIG